MGKIIKFWHLGPEETHNSEIKKREEDTKIKAVQYITYIHTLKPQ
jgi:hypothetical protein